MRRTIIVLSVLSVLLTACSGAGDKPAPTAAPMEAPAPGETRESLNDKAFAAIQAKDWPTAITLAEQAVKLDPAHAPSRFNAGLALAYEQAGQPDNAVAILRALAGRWPADGDIKQALTRLNGAPAATWQLPASRRRTAQSSAARRRSATTRAATTAARVRS